MRTLVRYQIDNSISCVLAVTVETTDIAGVVIAVARGGIPVVIAVARGGIPVTISPMGRLPQLIFRLKPAQPDTPLSSASA